MKTEYCDCQNYQLLATAVDGRMQVIAFEPLKLGTTCVCSFKLKREKNHLVFNDLVKELSTRCLLFRTSSMRTRKLLLVRIDPISLPTNFYNCRPWSAKIPYTRSNVTR